MKNVRTFVYNKVITTQWGGGKHPTNTKNITIWHHCTTLLRSVLPNRKHYIVSTLTLLTTSMLVYSHVTLKARGEEKKNNDVRQRVQNDVISILSPSDFDKIYLFSSKHCYYYTVISIANLLPHQSLGKINWCQKLMTDC